MRLIGIGATLKKRWSYYLLPISWVALITIILMVTIDVTGRFLFDKPLPASMEISHLLMPFIMFPAMAYALSVGLHIRVGLVTRRLSPRAQVWCEVFADVIGFALFAVVTYISWLHFWKAFIIEEDYFASFPLPFYSSKFPLVLGGAAFSLQFLINLVRAVRAGRSIDFGSEEVIDIGG
jgi:TRAP-type C4-dicarboxylate transport system permease small subunit